MPLKKGNSHEVVTSNIKELVKSGRPAKQAVAMALASKRKFKKMAEGGLVDDEYVGSDFNEAGTPKPMDSGDEDKYMTMKPSGGASLKYQEEEGRDRDLAEINEDGDYNPSAVANPMEQMKALRSFAMGGEVNPKLAKVSMKDRFAMGGLVDDPGEMHDMLGSKPSEDMMDGVEEKDVDMMSGKADLEHSMRDDYVVDSPKPPKDLGLSEEAMEALRQKKMKRRYPIVS